MACVHQLPMLFETIGGIYNKTDVNKTVLINLFLHFLHRNVHGSIPVRVVWDF